MAEAEGVSQVLWIADIAHLKYATVPPLQILKEIAHILQYYYPERLYRAYIVFSPWVFRAVFRRVSGLLTENTKGKLVVPGYEESAKRETFAEDVAPENLDARFGGELEMEYSYQWEVEQYQKSIDAASDGGQ